MTTISKVVKDLVHKDTPAFRKAIEKLKTEPEADVKRSDGSVVTLKPVKPA